jgi:uncharacterized protein involved in copper resistance
MLMTDRRKIAIGGVVAVLAALILATGSLVAQTAAPASGGTPAGNQMGEMGMMDMASPTADAAADADQMMTRMMEECMAMMQMMMSMMGGGDMSGMMEGQTGGAVPNMVTPAATPGF